MASTQGRAGDTEYDFAISESASIDAMMLGERDGTSGGFEDMTGFDATDADLSLDMHDYGNTWGSTAMSMSGAGSQRPRAASKTGLARTNSVGASENGSPDMKHRNSDTQIQAEDANAPAWSELKTKAGKERKRLPLACIACRRKKIRCSGEKPACKHCLRSRIPCVYKVTTRKAAPRTDYMAMLDKRLKRMEERVIKIIPKDEQGVVSDTGRAVVKPPLPPAPPKATGAAKKRAAEQAFGDELDEWANAKRTISKSNPESRADPDSRTNKTPENGDNSLLTEGADKLPSKDLQEHLAEVYFDYVYGQSYHLLHKPSFMRRLTQGAVPPVLTLAICAISARFSCHPAVRTEPVFLRGEQWAAPAREIALRKYDTPNITILIVYLLLGLHEFGTCQGGRSWMFGGMAQRMAYALQLHRDLDHDPKSRDSDGKVEGLTFTDREIRRRTMWSCFIMDRFNSSGTDRPVFVSEQYIRAQLPIKENYFQMEITGPTEDLEGSVMNYVQSGNGELSNAKENMGVAAYLIRLVAIWGKLIHYLNLGGKEKDKHPMWAEESMLRTIQRAADTWREQLPPSMEYTPDNLQEFASDKMANQFLLMHILYHQIILFMNCFALPTPGTRLAFPGDMPPEFVQNASRAAFESANQISALVKDAMDHLLVAPFAGYCAFFSSTVHMHGAFSKNATVEASSKQNLAWNVKYLTKMKKYWGMFHFVTENLRDLYRKHADVARNGGSNTPSAKAGESGIFQYGDWFDRYPHGVSGTDYEEPSTEGKKAIGADAVLGKKSDLQTVEEFFSRMSPKTAQTQKLPPKKRRRAKSEAPKLGKGQEAPVAQNSPDVQQQHQSPPPHASSSTDPLPQAQEFPGLPQNLHQLPAAFPPSFQQPTPNPFLITGAQQYMTQLDRQMVLNSYAGSLTPSDPSTFDPAPHNSYDPFNLDAFSGHTPVPNNPNNPLAGPTSNPQLNAANNANTNGTSTPASTGGGNAGLWGDPSTAWFMPFNMAPPMMGDDGHLFSTPNLNQQSNNNPAAAFDWANFGGFGDMPTDMPPTGLTPPLAGGDVDGGGGMGLDDMDGGF